MDIPSELAIISLPSFLILALIASLILTHLGKKSSSHRPRLPPSPAALPVIGHFHLLGPLIHQSFDAIASRYGPIVYLRLGSVGSVIVSNPDLAKHLLKTNELAFLARPHNESMDFLTYDNSSFAFSSYGPYWKFVKRLIQTELLGSQTINRFRALRANESSRFIRMLFEKSKNAERVNLSLELPKLANNIISQMMLGIDSSEADNRAEEARFLVREVTNILGDFNASDFFWFLKYVDFQGFRKRCMDVHLRYDKLLENIIQGREERRRNNKGKLEDDDDRPRDILDILLDIMEDGSSEMKLSRNHIKALFLDFLTAGTDTTAITVEWALAELINNPKVFAEARTEIDSVVGKDRIVGELDIQSLPFLQAVIKETMRLHPPIPMLHRLSMRECQVGEFTIPGDTMLVVNLWSMARNPSLWENPLDFRPGRFLTSPNGERGPSADIDISGHHFELLPFGTGRRGCPGSSLAMKETHSTLAALIQCFEWKVYGPDGAEVGAVDMSERPGLSCPRAQDIVCTPITRLETRCYRNLPM